MSVTETRPHFVLKGWHVLVGFLLFFGADIAVNTIFMVQAYRTFPGEASVTPYEDGLAYNKALAQERAQRALGWKIDAGGDASGALTVQAFDAKGAPLGDLHVVAQLQRPATETGRKVATFSETAPGVYSANVGPLSGAWDLEVTAHDEHGDKALAEHRLILP